MTAQPGTQPWRTAEIDDTNVWALYDTGGNLLADVYPVELEPSAKERARSIVQAVNHRDALLEALERVNRELRLKFKGDNINTTITLEPSDVALIREALRVARGGVR